jgi:hypothetical protein
VKGTYRFYQDGKLIGESENLLTTQGKRAILSYLAQRGVSIGRAISVGTGSTPATVDDESLEFEFLRSPITSVSPDYINGKIIFKTVIQPAVSGSIYEVGLFSQVDAGGFYGSRLITSFDQASEAWSNADWTSPNKRIGNDCLRLSATASGSSTSGLSGIYLDLSGYSVADAFLIAATASANVANVKLQFLNTVTDYFEWTLTGWTAGYNVKGFGKSQATPVGNPTWDAITGINLIVNATAGGTAIVDFDGLRIEDKDTVNPDYYLISRSILVTPIVKSPDSPLEIEYTLEVDIT